MHVLAYLDPGSGSMVLQMLLGGIAGLAVALKMFGKRIFRFFAFWKRDDVEPKAAPVKSATPKSETDAG
jgi:hypothetical protein